MRRADNAQVKEESISWDDGIKMLLLKSEYGILFVDLPFCIAIEKVQREIK